MEKAGREAKTRSSWAEPNPRYEQAVSAFVSALLGDGQTRFLAEFQPFQRLVARLGLYNSLSQCLLKLSAPGIPDIYQGCELWNFRLVDPDNRQPVDYGLASRLLAEFGERLTASEESRRGLAVDLLGTIDDGRIKLFVTWLLLGFRRDNPEIFRQGSYLPLSAEGGAAAHVIGLARRLGKKYVVAAASRFFAELTDHGKMMPIGPVWRDTVLEAPADADGSWFDVLTGTRLEVEAVGEKRVFALNRLFSTLPVAFLELRQ